MRGGTRPNAGRRRVLDEWQRLQVGLECEAKFNAIAEANQRAEINRVIGQSDYVDVIANMQAIPIVERVTWLQSEAYQTHCADVELERHAMNGNDPDENIPAERIISVPRRRPQGERPKIIAKVAMEWTSKLGRNVSESTVRKCWDEARAFARSLKAEEDAPGND